MATFAFREIYWGSLHNFYRGMPNPELASKFETADTTFALGIFALSLLALRRARFALCVSGFALAITVTGTAIGAREPDSLAKIYSASVGIGGFSFVLLFAALVADRIDSKKGRNSFQTAVTN